MRRWGRGVAWGVVACVGVASTSGCVFGGFYDEPPPQHRPVAIAALSLVGGVPTAVFAPCGETSVYRVAVTVGEDWKGGDSWATQRLDDSAVVSTLPLFTVPAGWYAENGNTAGFDDLGPDEPYVLYSSESTLLEQPWNMPAEVPFTLTDLQALGADEVWARPTPDAPAAAMPETDFRTAAATSCAAPPPSAT